MDSTRPEIVKDDKSGRTNGVTRRRFLRYFGYSAAALALLAKLDPVPPAWAGGGPPPLGNMLDNLRYHTPHWGDGLNFDHPEYYTTMTAGRRSLPKMHLGADINNDGRDELLIRSANGVRAVQYDPATGQWIDLPNGPAWVDNDNWNQPEYYRTMQTADINQDGSAELIIRNSLNVEAWQFDATAQQWKQLPKGTGWSDAAGWNNAEFYETIQCADIDGDGQNELLSRTSVKLAAFKLVSGDWIQLPEGPDLSSNANWNQEEYYQTLQFANINIGGTKRAVLIVRSSLGILMSQFDNVNQTWNWITTSDGLPDISWSDGAGWNKPEYYQTIQCADIDGDGWDELIARAPDNAPFGSGIQVWKYGGNWFPLAAGPAWSDGAGWNKPEYYQTIQCADIDGDGKMELLGRSGDGLEAFKYDTSTSSWRQLATLTELNDANGWGLVQYYSTIQSARVLKPGDPGYTGNGQHTQAVIIARNAVGVPTWRYDSHNDKWVYCSLDFPDWDPTTGQANAYKQIPTQLGIDGTNDIRSLYNVLSDDIQDHLNAMYDASSVIRYETPPSQRPPTKLHLPMTNPPTPDDWNAVTWQIYWELRWVQQVHKWYGTLTAKLITDTVIGNGFTLDDVLGYMADDIGGDSSIAFDILAAFASVAAALLSVPTGGASLAAVAGVLSAVFSLTGSLLPNGGSPLQTTANQLKAQLGDAYTHTQSANAAIQLAITGGVQDGLAVKADYGMLKFIGNNIVHDIWIWPSGNEHELIIERGYATYVWQQFMAAQPWHVYRTDKPPLEYPGNTQYMLPAPSGIDWLSGFHPADYLPLTSLQTLFDPVQTGQVFPLGTPLSDVYRAKNGWPALPFLSLQSNGASPDPDMLSPGFALDVELNVRVSLTRDPLTQQILVRVRLLNRGLTAADNVQLTDVKVNSQPLLSVIPSHHTRVSYQHPQTLQLRLPAMATGTAFTLKLAGRFIGGTFGGSFRLKAP